MTRESRIRRYRDGLRAESLAAWYLRLKGWRILERRFKTGAGEIDLIARRRGVVAFIEVKRRDNHDSAILAVTPASQARIARAAMFYLARHPEYAEYAMRFDVIAVAPPFALLHLDNAWQPPA